MNKIILLQGDKINFELDGEDYITEVWVDDLELVSNSLIVINNTLCCTGNIIKINEHSYEVQCFYQDAFIVQDNYYYGKQSELD